MRYPCIIVIPLLISSFIGFGQTKQLVISTIGDGATYLKSSPATERVEDAAFLVPNSIISVRPRSGLETIATGFRFRYGASTRFACDPKKINLYEGGLMVHSRKIESILELESPEASAILSGAGCLLAEAETNGGMKVIGILGSIRITCAQGGQEMPLLPGELTFIKPGSRGFGPKVQINLDKLISSSYLLSGFQNSSTFTSSLENTSKAQKVSTGRIFAAEVGDALDPDSFQIVKNSNANDKAEGELNKAFSMSNKTGDPLSELLGRTPYRSSPSAKKQTHELNSRPFPSRLLRTK
jgi:hypothetical protein